MQVVKERKQPREDNLPDTWVVKEISEFANVVRGGSPRPAGDPRFFNGNFIPWLTVASLTNISESELKVCSTLTKLTEEGSRRSRILEKGTPIIANSGATLGVAKLLGIRCCANDGIAALLNLKEDNGTYLVYFLNTLTSKLRDAIATGNGQPNLNTGLIGRLRIPLPPLPEQRAIAEALSDVDALIQSLDALITKKRRIKQGTMQQLLTGKKRLPGFSGEWEEKTLGTSALLKARIGWQGLTTTEYLESGDYRLVTGTDFKNGYIDWSNCHYVEYERYRQDRYIQLQQNDVLVTKDGTIGKVALVDQVDIPATLNSGVFVIRPKNDAFVPKFFYFLLCSRLFSNFLNELAAGSTINHLYQKDFVHFKYKLPPTQGEQATIAEVLSDMDAEITALEQKRDKTKLIKQGMMQELLTGKTRLV